MTSVLSLLVVHARPESQKVARPGGSQRGSQYPSTWPTGSLAAAASDGYYTSSETLCERLSLVTMREQQKDPSQVRRNRWAFDLTSAASCGHRDTGPQVIRAPPPSSLLPFYGISPVTTGARTVPTLYRWRRHRCGPPCHRVGRYLRYLPEEVMAWLKEQP